MKAAFLLAHTASGWSLLGSGPDSAALREQFKQIKVAGFVDVGEPAESADRILYFDTSGNMRRKDLDEASAVEGRKAAAAEAERKAVADREAAKISREEAKARAQAEKLARKAVAVIADGIVAGGESGKPVKAPAGGEAPAPVPAVTPTPAPVAPGVDAEKVAESSAPAGGAPAADSDDEAAAHFGGPSK